MRYLIREQRNDGTLIYEVLDADRCAAYVTYQITEDRRFFIREIQQMPRYQSDHVFRSILGFLEYKALAGKAEPVYVRIHEKNVFALERYLNNGFYVIDTEISTDRSGHENRILVLRNR